MEKNVNLFDYFNRFEKTLWLFSVTAIISSFYVFGGNGYLTLFASLIGVTSILFSSKGNPIGQLLMVFFSFMYAIISYSFAYYGEMISYIGMTMPMAAFALIAWLRHPHKGKMSEVEVYSVNKKDIVLLTFASIVVTIVFYFILKIFNTANLIPSTISITTSFYAIGLTYKRSPYFSLAYAFNDIILIILWALASAENIRYVSVIVCFVVFLINDTYAFINWLRIQKRQSIYLCSNNC